jgi:DNA invertase Pin-like site-specific DNA recombinase
MMQRVAIYVRQTGTEPELIYFLRRTVEHHGDIVVATYTDDGRLTGRGKYAEWRRLVANLNAVDQVVLSNAGDIPGKKVYDLLKILGILRDRSVGLSVHNIETVTTTSAVLDIVQEYRRAKLSQAIRNGQAKAVAAGKTIGRPTVPRGIASRIRAALVEGGGIRPTARHFNVSPASVINIRRSMATG